MIVLPRSERPLASIVIVTERNPRLLEGCLRALARHLPTGSDLPSETLVVLNGATPDTRALMDEGVTGAVLCESAVHLGLAGGLNLGRSKARGEFLVSLHDDTEIEAGWLEALLAAAVEDPAAGAVGSLVLDPDGSVQAAGRILWRDGRTSPVWPTGPGRRPPRREAFGARRPVDYADSSALLLRTAAFDAIGGADEDIHPAFYVDVDIAMGLRRLGYTIVVEPRSRCRHHRHGTTAGRSAYREFISERNRAHLRRKWATELEAYDPQARESPSAVARALTRAAEAARGATPRPLPVVAPPSFDLTARERRAEARDEALRSAWLAQLETALQAREADLDAITSTRWWRLYLKLLPLLSRLSPRAGRT